MNVYYLINAATGEILDRYIGVSKVDVTLLLLNRQAERAQEAGCLNPHESVLQEYENGELVVLRRKDL